MSAVVRTGKKITYPSVSVMNHARQKCCLVLQIPYSQAFQASDTTAPNSARGSIGTTFVCFPLELSLISARKTKLADIGHNNESPSENTFVSGFGPLD
jgi:hypothetical protein